MLWRLATVCQAQAAHDRINVRNGGMERAHVPPRMVAVTNVICRHQLARLPDEELRSRFMDVITEQAANDSPPFELDYWRLNLDARKPV